MSQVVDEVLAANKKCVELWRQEGLGTPAGARIRDTHLHGCASRSGEIRRSI